MTCIEAVTEFHAANGNAIDNPTQPGLALLRIGLITEELSETLTALRTRNIIDAADGLTDLLYVTYGAAVSYGLNLPDCFMESNEPPVDYVEHNSAARFAAEALRHLEHAARAMATCMGRLDDNLADLCGTVNAYGAGWWGLPMRELFIDVHASNMTKTFAPNLPGQKYGSVNPKGPGYRPPATADILKMARIAYLKAAISRL